MLRFSYGTTKDRDIFYITRVEISDPFFILEVDEKKYVFLDSREFGFFKEQNKKKDVEAVLLDPLVVSGKKLALTILETYGKGKKELEVSPHFPLVLADFLREQGYILDIKNPFYPARAVKETYEVDAIREAIQKTCKAYEKIEQILAESVIKDSLVFYKGNVLTCEELKKHAERVLFEADMTSSEGMIIASGKHSAIPHHPGAGPIRAGESIVCDLFPLSKNSGYFADMTRTYVKGKPKAKLQKMYDAVLEAQEKALAMIGPGVKPGDIHGAVCEVFEKRGFDVGEKGFTHSTGHGLGLELHEHPRVSEKNETPLLVGNVFTVEPGLYYPDLGGVRIEDVVVVTENGCENLTKYPKKFIID